MAEVSCPKMSCSAASVAWCWRRQQNTPTLMWPSKPADTTCGSAPKIGATSTLVAVFWCAVIRCTNRPLPNVCQMQMSVPPAVTSSAPETHKGPGRGSAAIFATNSNPLATHSTSISRARGGRVSAAAQVSMSARCSTPEGKKATDSMGAPWSTPARHRFCRTSHSLQMWSYLQVQEGAWLAGKLCVAAQENSGASRHNTGGTKHRTRWLPTHLD